MWALKKYLNGVIRFWAGDVHIKHGVLSRKPEPLSKSKEYYILKGPIDPIRASQIGKANKRNSPWNKWNSSKPNPRPWLQNKNQQVNKLSKHQISSIS